MENRNGIYKGKLRKDNGEDKRRSGKEERRDRLDNRGFQC